jgi:hypothetical protein
MEEILNFIRNSKKYRVIADSMHTDLQCEFAPVTLSKRSKTMSKIRGDFTS